MVDGAIGQNGPSVLVCVMGVQNPVTDSVITQFRVTMVENVLVKESKRQPVIHANVQVRLHDVGRPAFKCLKGGHRHVRFKN